MKCIYTKPELENLSQGERIAFARQMRNMTQDEVSEKLGFTGECKRRSMARYERGDRVPKDERLQEIADILNINVKCIKEYNFNDDEDMIYILLWMEEMFPRMNIDLAISDYYPDLREKKILNFMNEWKEMREKRISHEITYDEYIECKFQYDFSKGEVNEEY